jgi:hypothetical protein
MWRSALQLLLLPLSAQHHPVLHMAASLSICVCAHALPHTACSWCARLLFYRACLACARGEPCSSRSLVHSDLLG